MPLAIYRQGLILIYKQSRGSLMTLTFKEPNEQQRWYAVDDGVMGGQSHSQFSVVGGEGRFHGEVSLENGGALPPFAANPTTLNRHWQAPKAYR